METEDGRTVWYAEMGVTTEHTDVLAFAPTPAEVSPGDRVVFVNNSGAPPIRRPSRGTVRSCLHPNRKGRSRAASRR